jgi:hypothetical protein
MIGGGDGGTAARGACYFVHDPNISLETKRNVAIGGLAIMLGGTALLAVPELLAGGSIAGFTSSEAAVVWEARAILKSSQFAALRAVTRLAIQSPSMWADD